MLKPAIATLHCQGIRTITFIDDTLLIAATAEEYFHDISTTINLLESLGFHVNYGKSVLTPSQSISYLGFIIDTVSGTLLLPEPKLAEIITACQDLLKFPKVTLCDIAHVTGLLVSAFPETHGERSLEELEHHINVKELLAAFFAVQSFYPLHKNVLHIRLKIDNSTAVANINNYGSIKSPALNQLTREFWDWCLQRQLHLSAESIPGVENCIADRLSRHLEKRWCGMVSE